MLISDWFTAFTASSLSFVDLLRRQEAPADVLRPSGGFLCRMKSFSGSVHASAEYKIPSAGIIQEKKCF